MSENFRLLLVEDNPGDVRLIQEYLKDTPMINLELGVVDTPEKAQKVLEDGNIDLVLLDIGLPDSAGLETLAETIAHAPLVPVVVLTGFADYERAMEAINIGAQDYLAKDLINTDVLVRSIRYSILRKQSQVEVEQSELKYRSLWDNSTNCLAYHELVIDDGGKPIDSIFLDVNTSFEKITGRRKEDIIGKRFSEVKDKLLPADFDLAETFWKVALTGEPLSIEFHNQKTQRWFSVAVYSPSHGTFVNALQDITERKQAEVDLNFERERYISIMNALDDGIYVVDKNYDVEYTNQVIERVFGSVEGRKCYAYLHDREEPCPWCKIDEVFAGNSVRSEWYSEKNDRYYDRLDTPMKNADGSISKFEIFRDITETRKAQEGLERTSRSLRALNSCNEAIVQSVSEPNLYDAICKAIVEKAGYRLVWIGQTLHDEGKNVAPISQFGFEEGYLEKLNVSWADIDRGQGPTGVAIRTGKHCIARNIQQDPKFKPWKEDAMKRGYASSIALPLTNSEGVFGALNIYASEPDAFYTDEIDMLVKMSETLSHAVTSLRMREQKRLAQDALEESEERFKQFFEKAPVYCYMVSPQGVLLDVNEAALGVLGFTKDELVGKPLKTIYAPESLPKVDNLLAKWKETGILQSEQIKIITKTGKQRSVLLSAESIKDKDGNVIHSISVQVDVTKQNEAEDLLLEERNRAQSYLDIAGVIFIALDDSGYITMLNQRACKILGCSSEDYIGKNWFDSFIPERLRKEVSNVYDKIMHGDIENMKYFENEVVTLEGEERTIAWNNTLLTDSDGIIIGTLSSGEDITERKMAEEALKKSEQLNRMIVDVMSDLVLVYDSEGRYSEYFAQDDSLLVRPWNEMQGRKPEDLLPQELATQHNANAKQVQETGESIIHEFELETRNGLRWLQGTMMFNKDRGNLVSSVKDITERKLSENALRESEQRYRNLLESITDSVMVLDNEFRYVLVNEQLTKVGGIPSEKLIGNKLTDLFPGIKETLFFKTYEHVMATGEQAHAESEFPHQDGSMGWFEARVYPVPEGILVIVADITERKRSEQALRESEERHRLVLSSMSDLIFVMDKHNVYAEFYASDKITPLVPPEAFMGKNVTEILPLEVAQRITECSNRVRETGNREELEYSLMIDNETLWFLAVLDIHHDGESTVTAVKEITLRKKAEDEVKERESEYRTLVSNIPGAVYHCAYDKHWTMFVLGDAFESISGYPASDFIMNQTRSFTSIIHPDDRKYVVDEITKSVNQQEIYTLEYRIICADGMIRWIREHGQGIPDLKVKVGHLDGILFDITEERQAEEEMARLRDVQQASFELSLALGETLDLDTIYKTIYKHIEQLMDTSIFVVSYYDKKTKYITAGYVITDEGPVDVQNLPPIQLEDEGMGTQSQVIRTGKPLYLPDLVGALEKTKTEYTLKSGGDVLEGSPPDDGRQRSRSAMYVPLLHANEVVGVMQVQSYDINAYNQAQLDLLSNLANVVALAVQNAKLFETVEESEDRFRLLVEGTLDGILIHENMVFLDMNRRMAEMIGIDRTDLIGTSVIDHWTLESQEIIHEYVRSGSDDIIELDLLRSDGSTYKVEALGKECLYDGRKARIVATRNVTEQKKAQQETKQAADTALLYLDIMSHDVRNQLQAVVMASDIMQHMELDVESILALEIITESVEKSQKLINKVLSTRELLSIPLSELSLNTALESALESMKGLYDGIEIEAKYTRKDTRVNADKFIEQLLMNILENAVEYNERKDRKLWVDIQESGQGYQVSIRDNGQGISDAKKDSLFDPSRRFGGVGIHQTIRILQKYGGHISVHDRVASDPTQGAEFRIWFPKVASTKS